MNSDMGSKLQLHIGIMSCKDFIASYNYLVQYNLHFLFTFWQATPADISWGKMSIIY